MGLFDKIFGHGEGKKASTSDLHLAELLGKLDGDFDVAGAETDFALPAAWAQQAYIKFVLKGAVDGELFVLAFHEKSSGDTQLVPGHWLGIYAQYRGQSVGHPNVFFALGDVNSTNQQLYFRQFAKKVRLHFYRVISSLEPKHLPAASINLVRLAQLPWGEGAVPHHAGEAPPMPDAAGIRQLLE